MGLTLLWVWLGDVVGRRHRAIFHIQQIGAGYIASLTFRICSPGSSFALHPVNSLAVIIVYTYFVCLYIDNMHTLCVFISCILYTCFVCSYVLY